MDSSNRPLFYGSILLLLLTTTAIYWGDTIALALFINHLGIDALPTIIMIEAIFSIVVIFSFEQIKSYLHDALIVALICAISMGLIAVGWELVQIGSESGYGLYYIAQSTIRNLMFFYAWHYVASFYESHNRYLLPRINLYSRVGVIFTSLLLVLSTYFLETNELVLLWIIALLFVIGGIGIFADEFHGLPRVQVITRGTSGTPTSKFLSAVRSFFGSAMMRWLSLGSFAMMFVLTIIFFAASETFWNNFRDDSSFVRWLALLSAIGSIVILPIQYGLLPRALKRFKIDWIISIYPLTVGGTFALLWASPGLGSATIAELTRTSLRQSLYEPIQNQMKNTLPYSIVAWGHSFLDGVIDPIGRMAAAGILILFISDDLSRNTILIIGAVTTLLLVFVQRQGGFNYETQLGKSLKSRQYGFLRKSLQERLSTNDDVVNELLHRLKALDPDNREILLVAEALSESGSYEGFLGILEIWARCEPSLQAELLMLLAEGWPQQRDSEALHAIMVDAMESDNIKLRRGALQAMVFYPHLRDDFRITQDLIHPHYEVSTLGAQLMLQHPSANLRRAAGAQLRWLSQSSHASIRSTALHALVKGGINRFGERVVPVDIPTFQRDVSARVRMTIVPATELEHLATSAADVSSSVRQLAIKRLQEKPRQSTQYLQAALDEKRLQTHAKNFQLRATLEYWHLLNALASINRKLGQQRLIKDVERGLQQVDFITAMQRSLQTLEQPPLTPIIEQLIHERSHLVRAILRFIGAIHGRNEVRAITRTIQTDPDPQARSLAEAALARLSNPVIARQLKDILVAPRGAAPLVTQDHAALPTEPHEVVHILISQHDDWLALLVLYALSALPVELYDELTDPTLVEQILHHAKHSQEDAVREACRLLRFAIEQDDSDRSSDTLSRIAGSTAHKTDGESRMLSAIERMLFLRNVTFFENLRLDQLRTLTNICQEMSVNEGEYLLHKGEAGDSLYIIVEGELNVIDPDVPGDGALLAVRVPGNVLGEISLFDGGLRTADVVAKTPALLLVVHRETLDEALADDPGIALDMLRAMAQLVRENNQALSRLSRKLNTDRLADDIISHDQINAS